MPKDKGQNKGVEAPNARARNHATQKAEPLILAFVLRHVFIVLARVLIEHRIPPPSTLDALSSLGMDPNLTPWTL
jgi:hypothetical protein